MGGGILNFKNMIDMIQNVALNTFEHDRVTRGVRVPNDQTVPTLKKCLTND